jgi:hypothetical protein
VTYVDRWKDWYAGIEHPQSYGDTRTYEMAAEFLADCETVEDWGCGKGWMSTLIGPDRYVGIDGTATPFCSIVADLREYTSRTPGLFMRHVLEHNYDWANILENAVASFEHKMVLVTFTPFSSGETHEIAYTPGVEVPDMSFRLEDLTDRFVNCEWTSETIESATQYGTETIFYLRR